MRRSVKIAVFVLAGIAVILVVVLSVLSHLLMKEFYEEVENDGL